MVLEQNQKAMIAAARFISVLLHPLFIAPLTFSFLLYYMPLDRSYKIYYLLLILLAVNVIPFLAVLKLKRSGRTVSLDVPERDQRPQPFFISVGGYLVSCLLLGLGGAPRAIVVLMWIYAFNTLVATIITFYWKISIHGMAFSGPVAALGVLVTPQFYWLTLLLPLIVFARVILRAHNTAQVVIGYILGFILTFIQLRMLL